MKLNSNSGTLFPFIYYLLYVAFFTGFIFAFPAVSSISTGLLFIFGLVENARLNRPLIHARARNAFLITCSLFYLLVVVAVFFANDTIQAWSHVREKSGLLFIPLSLCCTGYLSASLRKEMMRNFMRLLVLATVYCLVTGIINYIRSGDSLFMFYHPLVAPIRQHAVHFSVYVFIAVVYGVEILKKNEYLFSKFVDVLLISFFTFFLFLLSSKIVLGFLLVYSIYTAFRQLRLPGKTRIIQIFSGLIVLGCILVALTGNPINSRFGEMINGKIEKVSQEKFTPGDYYSPIQFRLLEWRYTGEILSEHQAWLWGVSPGDAQALLDKKYISMNMYIGEPERGDRGVLGYNTHNQFLEATLQFGLIGTVVMLLIAFSVARIIIRKKQSGLTFILLLLLAYLFTESLFETQYGLLLFTFFPLFLSLEGENDLTLRN